VSEQLTLPPATGEWTITEPGRHALMPEAVYHDDPVVGGSLSSTGARKLLDTCPAKFRWWADNQQPYKTTFEVGKAAHRKVLGAGAELALFPGTGKNPEAWQKHDDIAAVDALRAEGKVPLKPSQMAMVDAMAEAMRAEPLARPLLDPDQGDTELSLFWRRGTVWGRSRPDRIVRLQSGRTAIVDYKSAVSAAPADVEKAIAQHGYHIQGAFYQAAVAALGICGEDESVFLLLVQEKEPPYLTTVVQPDHTAMRMGAIRVRQAFDRYAECVRDKRWPGYSDDVVIAELPPWETRELNGVVW
jgi:hypothetical protein